MANAINLHEFELMAREKLDKMVYDYYAGGANDEVTLTENRAAFARLRLRPRMLRGVEKYDMTTTILGEKMAAPLLIAPMAFMALAHPEGELAVARATAARGIHYVVSTMSNYGLEDIAAASAAAKWFQLYVYQSRTATEQMVALAEAAGYSALVLTVDTPVLGRREADIRNRFHLPPGYEAKNLANAQLQHIHPAQGDSGLAAYAASAQRANLGWHDLDWLRGLTKMPLLVKGILRGDDAKRALDHGAAGMIVSNHGGRQLDTAITGIEALPEVVAAVGGSAAVLMDGGVRRGTDILKALALGAQGVLLGRPVLWGLAVDGEVGVGQVLDLLLAEFELALALCGCASLAEVTPDVLWR
ncbi:MAG: alpha-hydroxy-acid oxidizing protein [Chloroflexi bacterium]|nr:alpha-hydroxy-acid oxidizing protein [Chloroflexota bacterium]